MKIFVNNKEIETKEIVSITDAGRRNHGFIINLIGDKEIEISEPELYDDYIGEKRTKNERYEVLKQKVIKEWEKDKTDFIILNL